MTRSLPAVLAAIVVIGCGLPVAADPPSPGAVVAMDVLPNKHAFVPATIRGVTGTVRIEPDSDVSYLLNTARERLGLALKDGMTPLPAFQLDGALTAETLVTVAAPDQQGRWLAETPDLLAVVGLDVLQRHPLLFDPARRRFGWGPHLRRGDGAAQVVAMQAKIAGVPVIEVDIDGMPVRLRVEPWASGLMVHGESDAGLRMLGGTPFRPQVRWGRFNWAMPRGEHAVAIGGRPFGRALVHVLAPYVAESGEEDDLAYLAEGWQGQLGTGALPGWSIVIDYPEQQVRLQPLVAPGR
jgi:hypothetical protein